MRHAKTASVSLPAQAQHCAARKLSMVKSADPLKQLDCVRVQCDGNRETAQRVQDGGARGLNSI